MRGGTPGEPIQVCLRPAEPADCETLFRWRNHPDIRRHFFDAREVPFVEHEMWFAESLRKSDRRILVAIWDGEPVGVIRFDLAQDEQETAEISIHVRPDLHSRGIGKAILRAGEAWATTNMTVRKMVARVVEGNQPSLKMFTGCGFKVDWIQLSKETAG